MSTTQAKVVLSVVDRITAPLAAIQRRIDRLTAPIRRISRAIGDMGRAAGIDRIAGSIRNVGSHLSTATGPRRLTVCVIRQSCAGCGRGFRSDSLQHFTTRRRR